MKTFKITFSLCLITLFTFTTSAQNSDERSRNNSNISRHAIGLRIGDGDGFGTEISYQRGLSSNNRLELDFGWRDGKNYDGFKFTGIYQWVWTIESGFNWYAGVGAGVGSYSYDKDRRDDRDDDSETFFLVAGQVGIEYNFDGIPLQLSLDTRPGFGFGNRNNDFDFDIALGIRYKF